MAGEPVPKGKGNVGQTRTAWLEAVEDKENVDPASGLTVTTRRQRRRLVAAPAQSNMLAGSETPGGQASKEPRQPLTDITPAFPEATVLQDLQWLQIDDAAEPSAKMAKAKRFLGDHLNAAALHHDQGPAASQRCGNISKPTRSRHRCIR
ncbi:hypothetical protein WJX74_001324 [Apatococcus lobatus]|uniref:Uncharacterized protein n=1 Tax=Apatococcus lobatus TaxID=904363 RepID=A0AAW1RL89_9CHLO